MHKRRNAVLAAAAALMMVVTLLPMGTADAGSGDGVTLVQNGNGSYSVKIPFLEEHFGIPDRIPDAEDPYHGVMGITCPEIHAFYGNNSQNYIIEPNGGSKTQGPTVTSGMSRGTGFSAGFSGNYLETGVEDIFTIGLTTGGQWFVQNTTNTDAWKLPENGDKNREYLDNLVAGAGGLMLYQSSNLFPYAVGDFVEDDETEEFAVYLGNTVEIFDCSDYSGDYMWPTVSFELPADPYSGGYGVNPVCMAPGDYDGDGRDEIAVTVEYSKDHGSPEACALGEHQTWLYLLDPDQPDKVDGARITMSVKNDVQGVKENLDVVMTSAVAADYDFDWKDGIVLGGYLWDNSNRSHDANCDPNNFTGELYLATFDVSEMKATFLNRLMDDAYTDDPPKAYSPTPYDLPATNGDYTDGRDYKDHSEKDTSIMLEDWSDNSYGYCRSPNWNNWTVPMAAVCFESAVSAPYIYLDNCVYTINEDGVMKYDSAIPLDHYQDNNNCQCTYIGTGSLIFREDAEYVGYQDLYRCVAMDRQDNDGGCQHWMHCIDYMQGRNISSTVVDELAIDEWAPTEPLMGCIADRDVSDRVQVKYMGVIGSIADPTVIVAISEIPYDSDLPDCLKGGVADIGSTTFTTSQSHADMKGREISLQLDFAGGIDTWHLELDAAAGYDFRVGWSNEQTMTVSYSFTKSEDSVTVYMLPYDTYTYKVTRMVDGSLTSVREDAIRWYEPVQATFTYEDYLELVDQYNESLGSFAKNHLAPFQRIAPIPEFEHVPGDIGSYATDKMAEYAQNAPVSEGVLYTGDGLSGSSSVTVELSESHEFETMTGHNANVRLYGSILFGLLSGGVELEVDGEQIDTHTNSSAMAFTSKLTSGLVDRYAWDKADAETVMEQYGMTGTMWADQRSNGLSDYVHIGYTVNSWTSACKNGWVAPDRYSVTEGEGEDPHDPGSDYLWVKVFVPGDVREDLLAQKYVLQMRDSSGWLDLKTLRENGVVFQKETSETDSEGNYILKDLEDEFMVTPGTDQTMWVRVSGLSEMEFDRVFDFRLVGYTDKGAMHPCKGAVGVLKSASESFLTVEGFSITDREVLLAHSDEHDGYLALRVMTDLDPGTLVSMVYEKEDETIRAQSVVGADGDAIIFIAEEPKREPVPVPVTLLVFAGILVCLAAGAYVLRKP